MPIKLIGIIILMVLVAVLTGFNLGNTCTIWFFHTFTGIPVFALILGSFIVGVFVTLPFTFGKHRDRREREAESAEPKKSRFGKKSRAETLPVQTVTAVSNAEPEKTEEGESK